MPKSLKTIPPIVRVPETVLKKRKRILAQEAQLKEKIEKKKQHNRQRRQEILKRAEKYLNEYEKEKKKQEFLKYQAMKVGNFYVAPEPKIAFVVRIRGLKDISPKVRKALQLMRLRQINTGVFIKLNKASLSMLKIVEPFVAWGYPDLETVKKLIYKRAHVKVNGTRTPILGNGIIEEHLGKYNIICVEDLIHEIWTVGPHFKEANNFLWPFKLHSPRGGYKSIKKHFIEGGAYGNREEYINELIAAML